MKELIEKQKEFSELAIKTIRAWHGMNNVDEKIDGTMWNIYNRNSPEMKRLNAIQSEITELKSSQEPGKSAEEILKFFDNEKGDVSIESKDEIIGYIKTKLPANLFNCLLQEYALQFKEQPVILDEKIEKQFPTDLNKIKEIEGIKGINPDIKSLLGYIRFFNLNKQIGAKWMRDQMKAGE